MAEASIEERHLLKSLRWWDGFVIALCNPGFLIASLGFSMDALGTWGAVALWGISACVGMLQTWIYAESASMFPDKPGGISLYAHEGWRGRFSLAGPIGAFGYWIGWSVVLAIFGETIGDLITGAVVPDRDVVCLRREGAPGAPPLHRHRLHRRRMAAQHLRHTARGMGVLRDRLRAPGPAGHLHLRAVLHGGLAQLQHDLVPARLERVQDCDGVAVPDGMVDLRRRGMRDLRSRVQGHQAGHDDRAAVGRGVHAAGVPAVPAGHRRGHRRADRASQAAASSTSRPSRRSWAAARRKSSSCC